MTKTATQLRNEKLQRFGRKYAKAIAYGLRSAGLQNVKIGRGKFVDTYKTEWRADISADGLAHCQVWVDIDAIISGSGSKAQEVNRAQAHMNIGLPFENKMPAGFPRWHVLQDTIVRHIKNVFNAYAKFSDNPWYYDTHAAVTFQSTLGELDRVAYQEPVYQSSAPRYDPQQAFLDRQTPSWHARQARISQHQFASDIGGCSANYRF